MVLMSPFSWQCQNLCLLNLAFIIDWRVVYVKRQSQRAQGSQVILRSNEKVTYFSGPASYADALKKNLKFRPNYIPVEDVFETWKDLLADPEDLMTPSTPTASTECGQPTVKVAAITEQVWSLTSIFRWLFEIFPKIGEK